MMSIKIRTAGLFFSVALVVVALVVATTTLSVVESVTTSQTSRTLFNTAFTRQAALSTLQGAIGYGGMIHNFKNYVLRQDAPRIKAIEQNMADVRAAIDSLRATGLNGAEETALTDIARVVAAYADRLALAREMAERGEDPRAIDKVIKIDDSPALKGIATITDEVAKTVRHSNDTLAAGMDRMESLAGVVLVAVAIVLFIFALINLWWIGVWLIRPMTAMVETMGRLAGGNTAIDVPGRGRGDEIGAMATAVTVFHDSMIEADRLRAEQASAQEQAQQKRSQEIKSFADALEEKVSGSIMAVFQGAGDITATAGQMGAKIDQSSGRSLEAAEASGRTSHDISAVARCNGGTLRIHQGNPPAGGAISGNFVTSRYGGGANQRQGTESVRIGAEDRRGGPAHQRYRKLDQPSCAQCHHRDRPRRRCRQRICGRCQRSEKSRQSDSQGNRGNQPAYQRRAGCDARGGGSHPRHRGATITAVNQIAASVAVAMEEQGAATEEIFHNVRRASDNAGMVAENMTLVTQGTAASCGSSIQVIWSANDLAKPIKSLQGEIDAFLTRVRTD